MRVVGDLGGDDARRALNGVKPGTEPGTSDDPGTAVDGKEDAPGKDCGEGVGATSVEGKGHWVGMDDERRARLRATMSPLRSADQPPCSGPGGAIVPVPALGGLDGDGNVLDEPGAGGDEMTGAGGAAGSGGGGAVFHGTSGWLMPGMGNVGMGTCTLTGGSPGSGGIGGKPPMPSRIT